MVKLRSSNAQIGLLSGFNKHFSTSIADEITWEFALLGGGGGGGESNASLTK